MGGIYLWVMGGIGVQEYEGMLICGGLFSGLVGGRDYWSCRVRIEGRFTGLTIWIVAFLKQMLHLMS